MSIPMENFSSKQKEVISLLLRGKKRKDIALILNISPNTLKSHLSRIKAIMKIGGSKFEVDALTLEPPKIIVIEDDLMLLKALEHNLSMEGYQVFTADDGSKAIPIIREEKLDLVICDLFMPHVSGFALIAILKELFGDELPIIVISSPRNKATLEIMSLGRLDFIPKPIQFPTLLEKVKHYEKLRFKTYKEPVSNYSQSFEPTLNPSA